MVSFSCQNCNDTVKKPKLQMHMNRCQAPVDCIDCSTTFDGHSAKAHTSCMTEEQKYQKNLYHKPTKTKAVEMKQEPESTTAPAPATAPAPTQEKKKKKSKTEKKEKEADEEPPSTQKESKKRKKSKTKDEANDDSENKAKDTDEPSKKKKKKTSTEDGEEKPKKKKKAKKSDKDAEDGTENVEKPKKKKKSKKSESESAVGKGTSAGADKKAPPTLFTDDDLRDAMRHAIAEQQQGTTIEFQKMLMSILKAAVEIKKNKNTDEPSQEELTDAHRDIANQVLRTMTFTKSDDGNEMLLGIK